MGGPPTRGGNRRGLGRCVPGLGTTQPWAFPKRKIGTLGMWIPRRARAFESFVAPRGARSHSSVICRFCSSVRGGPGGRRPGWRRGTTPDGRPRGRSVRRQRGVSPPRAAICPTASGGIV